MKLRLPTGLALALALGGCTTYGYVGEGGGYYTGRPAASGYGYSGYGSTYGGYGYGLYGYGSSYSSYLYRPGWSFGLGYGYPYAGSYYPYGYYGGGHYRPPYYYPRPPHGQNPPHPPRPGDHDGRPERPPTAGTRPPLDRAPWRDLDRLRRGERQDDDDRPRWPRPGAVGASGPQPGEGIPAGGMRPRPLPPTGASIGDGDGRRFPVGPGYRVGRPQPATDPAAYGGQSGRPRFAGAGEAPQARQAEAQPRQMQPQSRSVERVQRAPERSEPRSPPPGSSRRDRSATRDTIEP